VSCHPDYRGRGLGSAVVGSAFGLVDEGLFEAALFQTRRAVQPFYERLGAGIADNRFVNSLGEDPERNPFWNEVVLRYPASAPWPEGTIDLMGLAY
jgi:hypothetical protein